MLTIKDILHFDFLAFGLTTALIVCGLFAISGASAPIEDGSWMSSLWFDQFIRVMIGVVFMSLIIFVDYQTFTRYSFIFYIAAVILLLLCFSPIGQKTKGAFSWLKVGGLPSIQPSEFAKLAVILFLANILSRRHEQWNGLLDMLKPLAIGIIPSLLILKQPDLGTAIIFGPVTIAMMIVSGMPLTYVLLMFSPFLCFFAISHEILFIILWFLIICSLLLMAIIYRVPATVWTLFLVIAVAAYIGVFQYGETIWEKLPDHQKSRIEVYLNPETNLKSTNWNINQSKIALGSGGMHGKGFGNGTQSTHGFLPEYQHDFIFPTIGEQFGFFGTMLLLSLFLLLLLRGIDTALETKSLQGSLIASGIVAMFFSHIFINVGMVTGLIPVTGLPLTFISYGGSFMITNLMAVGLLINVRMRSAEEYTKDSMFKMESQMSIPTTYSSEF
jgi:rod shape determining protein RodA